MALLLKIAGNYLPRAPAYSIRITLTWNQFWAQSIHPSLVPQQQPPGKRIFDLPPKGYPLPGFTWYGLNPNLFPPPAPPDTVKGKRGPHFTPPRGYPPPGPTWAWWFPLELIPAPQIPAGAQETDLPPRGYPEPATRTWI